MFKNNMHTNSKINNQLDWSRRNTLWQIRKSQANNES